MINCFSEISDCGKLSDIDVITRSYKTEDKLDDMQIFFKNL